MDVNENFCSLCYFSAWLTFIMKTSVSFQRNKNVIQILHTRQEWRHLFRCENHLKYASRQAVWDTFMDAVALNSLKQQSNKGKAGRCIHTSSSFLNNVSPLLLNQETGPKPIPQFKYPPGQQPKVTENSHLQLYRVQIIFFKASIAGMQKLSL